MFPAQNINYIFNTIGITIRFTIKLNLIIFQVKFILSEIIEEIMNKKNKLKENIPLILITLGCIIYAYAMVFDVDIFFDFLWRILHVVS